jgi:charged multivesicular body protein 5
MADLLEVSADLQDTMSRNYAVPEDVDEEELDAELEALYEDMEFDQAAAETEGVPSYLVEDTNLPEFVDEPVAEDKKEEKVSAS